MQPQDAVDVAANTKLRHCSHCGACVSATDRFCAGCGTAIVGVAPSASSPASAGGSGLPLDLKGFVILFVIAAIPLIWVLMSLGEIPSPEAYVATQAQEVVNDAKQQVATDIEREYDLATRSGSKMDKCVAAGMAVAAYLQAHDTDDYARAVSRRDLDCAAAGIPPG